jgi:4-amino-4-deoxy-L-arabinose transferase-like glycosyltransferase
MAAKTLYFHTLWITFLLKLALASVLPMSGDEAYFILWAQHLDYGYYDHPPMVGWILYLLQNLGHAAWFIRLPAVLFSSWIGILIYRLLAPSGESRAAFTASLFLVWPITLINVLITTDTPLILFVFLSVYALVKAVRGNQQRAFVWSGLWLGCAFLSKYFAVLLGLAYFAWFVFTQAGRARWRSGLLLAMTALPAVALNVYWNYTHCWDNILFNLYNRNVGAGLSWHDLGLYLITTLYLTTPPALWAWWQSRREPAQDKLAMQIYGYVFAIPVFIFFVLSWGKTIGLHWVLAFYPFYFLLLGSKLPEQSLLRLFRFMRGFAFVHGILLVTILLAPAAWWQHTRFYSGYVLLTQPAKVLSQLKPYTPGMLLATNDYSTSAIMSYHSGHEYFVYGPGSQHARQDDMNTDYRQLDGHNILIFDKSPTDIQQYAPYFSRVVQKTILVNGAKFYLASGYDFHYAAYRVGVLARIRQKYYRIPAYLPHAPCYFCTKYFSDGA